MLPAPSRGAASWPASSSGRLAAGRAADVRRDGARRAGRAVGLFLVWCEARGLGRVAASPLHVAALHPEGAAAADTGSFRVKVPAEGLEVGPRAQGDGKAVGRLFAPPQALTNGHGQG